ncbi:MAG: GerMN domain-containing protein [Ruminococcus sp.]|nr:GerMN domain-containing protein [Ruminococcus sp.]
MLKKSALRRIMVSTIALIIVSILYFFPTSNEIASIPFTTNYVDVLKSPIYLINKDNYVIRTDIVVNSESSLDKAKELIEALTIDSTKSEYIVKNFKPIIPKNTKVIEISLENNLLKVNFSKEFLNVTKDEEEKLIEALVYTLTEISDIKEIMVFIEGKRLEMLPQSKIKLPNTINRNIGINKVYDLDNLKDSSKTTIYYINKEDDLLYYVPVTKVENNSSNKVEIIIEELKSSPIYQTNLISYLASSTELLNYEALENQISLSFNQAIFEDLNEKNIKEEVKYSISLSLKDAYDAKEVIFKVDDEIITTWKAFS